MERKAFASNPTGDAESTKRKVLGALNEEAAIENEEEPETAFMIRNFADAYVIFTGCGIAWGESRKTSVLQAKQRDLLYKLRNNIGQKSMQQGGSESRDTLAPRNLYSVLPWKMSRESAMRIVVEDESGLASLYRFMTGIYPNSSLLVGSRIDRVLGISESGTTATSL